MRQNHWQQGRHGAGTQHDQLSASGASNQLDHRYRQQADEDVEADGPAHTKPDQDRIQPRC